MVVYYAIICLSGAIVTFWNIYIPAIQYIKQVDRHNIVVANTSAIIVSGVLFFLGTLFLGIFCLLILVYKEAFLQNFINGLMGNNE